MGDRPGTAVGLQALGAHLAVDADEPGAEAEARRLARQFVDAKTLGDAGKIEPERCETPGAAGWEVELQRFRRFEGHPPRDASDQPRVRRPRSAAEPEGADEIADADVEGAVRKTADFEPGGEHRGQLLRDFDPEAYRRGIEALQI